MNEFQSEAAALMARPIDWSSGKACGGGANI